jgi:hypothetical protein
MLDYAGILLFAQGIILWFCAAGVFFEHRKRPFRVPVAWIIAAIAMANMVPGWFILAFLLRGK